MIVSTGADLASGGARLGALGVAGAAELLCRLPPLACRGELVDMMKPGHGRAGEWCLRMRIRAARVSPSALSQTAL